MIYLILERFYKTAIKQMPQRDISVTLGDAKTRLSDHLKEQTKTQHQMLEKQIIPLIKAIRITKDYSDLLMYFYTFFGGLELLVDGALHTACLPDYLQRRKISLLSNDLHAMDVPVQPFANGKDLPTIGSHLQALGAMYVMEGSTLGGQHISKMINDQINQVTALAFFNAYKSETQNMWTAFKSAIDEMLLDSSEEAVVIKAANDTFTRFSAWLTHN